MSVRYQDLLIRVPHTEPLMRVAGLRGDRYFTHFEVVSDKIGDLHAGNGTMLHEKWLSASISSILFLIRT